MLVIRFFRVGKRNQPSFKIVVTDKRKAPRAGRFTEEVGFWNPLTKGKVLKTDRIKYWISVGAKPSNSLHNLLVQEKIIEGKKIAVHKVKKEKGASAEAKETKVAEPKKETASPAAPAASAAPEPKEEPKPETPETEEKKPEEPKPELKPEPKPEPKSETKPETKEAPKQENPADNPRPSA